MTARLHSSEYRQYESKYRQAIKDAEAASQVQSLVLWMNNASKSCGHSSVDETSALFVEERQPELIAESRESIMRGSVNTEPLFLPFFLPYI
jgi:hypothetical protein